MEPCASWEGGGLAQGPSVRVLPCPWGAGSLPVLPILSLPPISPLPSVPT